MIISCFYGNNSILLLKIDTHLCAYFCIIQTSASDGSDNRRRDPCLVFFWWDIYRLQSPILSILLKDLLRLSPYQFPRRRAVILRCGYTLESPSSVHPLTDHQTPWGVSIKKNKQTKKTTHRCLQWTCNWLSSRCKYF